MIALCRKLFYHISMSFDLKSEGKFCRSQLIVAIATAFLFFSLGCELNTKNRQGPVEQPAHIQNAEAKLDAEVSLSGDQKTIEQLRENIPAEKRADNDLLKETLGMMGEVKEPPQRHRDRFNKQMREIRNDQRKADRKARDQFRKKERKDREAFQKAHRERRERFNKLKVDRDQRREFYNEQDEIQKDFYAKQKDARKEFDAEMRTKRSDFNSYLKDRQTQFNEEYKIYSTNYRDLQKQKKDAEKARRQMRKNPQPSLAPTQQLRTEE